MIRGGIRRAFQLALRGRTRWEREVEEEIRHHLSLRAEQLVSRGASADDAYREAVARFGPLVESRARLIDAARHREQRMQRTEYFSDLQQDVSFAVRTLARQRAWTAVIIFTFALGIGATTAVFSVVSRLMLHPVPYPNADRVVIVEQQPSSGNSTGLSVSITPGTKVFRAWRPGAHSFESLVGYSQSPVSMKTDGDPSVQNAARIVPEFPAFAGEHPIVGRMFTTADIASGERVVVLGESFWRQHLGAERSAIGRRLTLDDTLYTIIGVMPSTFALPGAGASTMSFWLPFDVRNDNDGLSALGRLRPGATLPAARAELDSIFARTGGFTSGKIPFNSVVARPGSLVSFRDSLVMLTAAVGLVLLIACANVAHLLVARGASRQRELAIRAALGAARGRLLRQLVTESLIISASGTALGLVLGWIGLHTMIALRPRSLSALAAAHLDATTVGVALALTVASGLVFGVIGSLQSARQSTNDALKSGAVGRGPRVRARVRGLIVVTEMALSATLLVGATMLIRSVVHLQRADLGFEPANLYQVYGPVPKALATSTDKPARAAYLAELTAQLRRAGGVAAVSVAEVGPGSRRFSVGRLEIEGEPAPPATSSSFTDVNQVDPGFFTTMRIPIVRGSTFTDTSTTTTQVIVNRGFAAKHWADASALGRRIRIVDQGASDAPWLTIVGIAGDAATTGPDLETSTPILYTPFDESGHPTLLVRTGGDTLALAHVRTIVAAAAQRRTVTIESVATRMAATITAPRFVMLLLTVLTGLALVLAGVGLYGVMSFMVAQQTREIGIRVALGASRGRVARAILSRGTALAAVGAAIGLVVSRWGTHLIENQLYGVTRSDPASLIIGALVLMSAALLACVVPTRRALAVDPMTAIRAD